MSLELILSILIGGPVALTALVLWAMAKPAPEEPKAEKPYARARWTP